MQRRSVLKLAALLPLIMGAKLSCGAKSPPTGRWLVIGQAWIGSESPNGDWYQLGTNSDGEPFWVKRGSDVDHILNRKSFHAQVRYLKGLS